MQRDFAQSSRGSLGVSLWLPPLSLSQFLGTQAIESLAHIPAKWIPVRRQEYAPLDDHSRLQSRRWLIANGRNEGFAGGHNVGIRAALGAGADYVVLLNQDIVAQPGWLGQLVDAGARHPEISVFAPLVLDYEGRAIDPLCLRILALSPAYRARRPPLAALEPLYEVGAAFAAALCVRAEVLRRVGLFDPLFFTYHEEGDFFQRARYHGVRTAVVTQSRIHHWHTGVRPDAYSRTKLETTVSWNRCSKFRM